jgi:hypothetical protein
MGIYPNRRWGEVLRATKFHQPPWITHWPWYEEWCNYTSFRGQDCDPDGTGYDCFMQPKMNNITATAVVLPVGGHAGSGERSPLEWSPCLGTAANCCLDFVCWEHFNENGTSVEYGGDPDSPTSGLAT